MTGFPTSFIATYVSVLILGAFLSEASVSLANAGVSVFCFLLAWALHYYLFRVDYMRSDVSTSSRLPGISQKIYFKGSELDTFEHEDRERDFLSLVAGPKREIFYRLAYILVACVYGVLMSKEPRAQFTLSSAVQLLAAFSLIPICSLSHFVLPLVISAIAVIISVMKSAGSMDAMPIFGLVVWLCLLVVTISIHRALVRNVSTLIEPRKAFEFETKQGFLATGVILSLVLFFHWIIPDRLEAPKIPDEALIEVAEKLNTAAAKWAPRKSTTSTEASHGSESEKPPGSDSEEVLQNLEQKLSDQDKRLLRHMKEQKSLKSLAGEPGAEKGSQLGQLPETKGGNEAAMPSGTQSSEADTRDMKEKLRKIGEQSASSQMTEKKSDGQKMTDAQKAELEGALKEELETAKKDMTAEEIKEIVENQAAKEGSPSGADAGAGTAAGAKEASGEKGSSSIPGQPENLKGEVAQKADQKAEQRPDDKPPDKPPEKPPEKLLTEDQIKMLVRLFKFVLAMCVVGLFLKILLPYTQKPKAPEEDKPQRASKQKRSLIYRQLQDLAKIKLSPQEEVIKKYQIFLETMDSVELGKHPSLPPTHYLADLVKDLPSLRQDFETITYAFCDVLYGEKKPEPERLRDYRNSVDRVLGQFL
jgi:hypothetical protein